MQNWYPGDKEGCFIPQHMLYKLSRDILYSFVLGIG